MPSRPGRVLAELRDLWVERHQADAYIGTRVNEYLARGGKAVGIKDGSAYVDVGTVQGYRDAIQLLGAMPVGPIRTSNAVIPNAE